MEKRETTVKVSLDCRAFATVLPQLAHADDRCMSAQGTDPERVMWFVFEAEYQIENGRANWNRPIPETMVWHGPFANADEADKVVRGRMWAKIDIYAHKARSIDLTVKD